VQGRDDLTQRSNEIDARTGHTPPDIPSLASPLASKSGASAGGPSAVPVSHRTPPFRQLFTGVTSPCRLTLRKRRKEGT
jgi:hypothetical protein